MTRAARHIQRRLGKTYISVKGHEGLLIVWRAAGTGTPCTMLPRFPYY